MGGVSVLALALLAVYAYTIDARMVHTSLSSDCDDFQSHTDLGTSNYESGMVKTWNITVSAGKRINLQFPRFEVSRSGDWACRAFCKCDYVEVYDGDKAMFGGRLGRRLCGRPRDSLRNFTSSGNALTVHFVTNNDGHVDEGFLAQYNAIGNDEELNIEEGSAPRCSGPLCGMPAVTPKATKIVGGEEANAHSWPWMVYFSSSFSSTGPSTGSPWCGGTLINDQWVLTAAHCMAGESTSGLYTTLGAHEWGASNEGARTMLSSRIIMHPGYNDNTLVNDYALVKLAESVTFSDNISPACMPTQDEAVQAGGTAIAAGWGRLSSGGSQPNKLMQVALNIFSDARCNSDLGSSEYVEPLMMCAGIDGGGKDTCQGDSGGPLVYFNPLLQRYQLIGVTSWGIGCAQPGNPGVYARVSAMRQWIDDTIQNN